jgi:hypothetical protein
VPILCWANGRVDDAKSAIITAITITREKASQEVITADLYRYSKMGVQEGEGRRWFPDELFAGFTATKFLDDPEFSISFQPDVATGLSAHHSLAVATDGTFSVTEL